MSGKRRDSIVFARNRMVEILDSSFEKLREIWTRVGLNECQRQERMDTAINHFRALADEMLDEEQKMERELLDDVSKFALELTDLSSELNENPTNIPDGLSLIEREVLLRTNVDDLRRRKHDLIKRYFHLCKLHQSYSLKLGTDSPYYEELSSTASECESRMLAPTSARLELLQAEVDQKENLLAERRSYVDDLRKRALDLRRRLNQTTESDIENRLFHSSDIVLSDELMTELAKYSHELEASFASFLANIRYAIEKARRELVEAWDLCCISEAERARFPALNEDNYSEEILRLYRHEIERLNTLHESKRSVLDNVNEWKELFEKMKYFDEKSNDPNRYNNRGGGLLREEKERKLVQKRLPEVEQKVFQVVKDWETVHHQKFFIYGMPVADYIENQRAEFEDEKELAKIAKAQKRKQQLEHERKFGAVPQSPKQRPNTPTKTPLVSRINRTNSVKEGQGRYAHSSLAAMRSPLGMRSPGSGRPPLPPATVSGKGGPDRTPLKRKAFFDQENQPHTTGGKLAASKAIEGFRAGTPTKNPSMESCDYQEFSNHLCVQGSDVQSSRIVVSSPTKQRKFF